MLQRLFGFWAFGPAAETMGPEAWWVLISLVGLAAGALWAFPRRRAALALLALYLIVPTAGLLAFSSSRPLSDPKQLLILAPAFLLWLGAGAAAFGRALAWGREPWSGVVTAGLALAAAATFWGPLQALYFDPSLARDDYRGLVSLIEAQSGPQDGVILNAPGQAEVFSQLGPRSKQFVHR